MAWRARERGLIAENAGANVFWSASLLLIDASVDLILVLPLLSSVVITILLHTNIWFALFSFVRRRRHRGTSWRSKSVADDYSSQTGRRESSSAGGMEVSDNVTGVYGNREELLLQKRVDDEIQENEENELLQALQAEREAQSALHHELEKERNAAATAANEAMAMITRLQEEKAVAQMEARQFQRMVEEKTIYDREAMEVLKEVLARREEEKKQLEEEIRICRMKLLLRSAQEEDQRDHQAVPESSNVAVPVLELSKRSPEAEAELIRETGLDSAGIKEVVQEKNNNGQEPCAAGFWDKEIEEKRLSVLEYVWRFEEQLQQQGDTHAAPQTGRPKSAGELRTKVKAREGRTMCSESSRKTETLISEIMEKDPLRRRLFEEEVMMKHNMDSFSLIEREEDRGSGKLEREESRGRDDIAYGLMDEHAAEDCEEKDLFMQDIYEVHNAAPHAASQHIVMQDKGDYCWGWDHGRRYKFDSDRLGKPDLLMLHEEEETQHTTSGEHAYQPEDLCDKEIRDSSTIGRDSAPFEDEVMHLMLRLKALEADRDLMKQTIESLRRENGEMKLLQEIAQQLRELRATEQTDLQQQLTLLPFASSCQVNPDSL